MPRYSVDRWAHHCPHHVLAAAFRRNTASLLTLGPSTDVSGTQNTHYRRLSTLIPLRIASLPAPEIINDDEYSERDHLLGGRTGSNQAWVSDSCCRPRSGGNGAASRCNRGWLCRKSAPARVPIESHSRALNGPDRKLRDNLLRTLRRCPEGSFLVPLPPPTTIHTQSRLVCIRWLNGGGCAYAAVCWV